MGKKMNSKTNKMNPVLWFLFAIIIPMIITALLTMTVLSAAGVNVFGWLKTTGTNIPVVSTFIKTDEELKIEESRKEMETTISDQRNKISQLNDQINDLESMIDHLEQEINTLETSHEKEDHPENFDDKSDTLNKLTSSFKKINKKQAALIIQDLDPELAILLLDELSNDARGGILEAMDPEQAAVLTELYFGTFD